MYLEAACNSLAGHGKDQHQNSGSLRWLCSGTAAETYLMRKTVLQRDDPLVIPGGAQAGQLLVSDRPFQNLPPYQPSHETLLQTVCAGSHLQYSVQPFSRPLSPSLLQGSSSARDLGIPISRQHPDLLL